MILEMYVKKRHAVKKQEKHTQDPQCYSLNYLYLDVWMQSAYLTLSDKTYFCDVGYKCFYYIFYTRIFFLVFSWQNKTITSWDRISGVGNV